MDQSSSQVAVITVPLPAHGHLNQMLQLSSLLSSSAVPTYYATTALNNRQLQARTNSFNPHHISKIHFHDLPTPPFLSPPANTISPTNFPSQLHSTWYATLNLQQPVAAFLHDLANKFKRTRYNSQTEKEWVSTN